MKLERQIEEAARIDGYEFDSTQVDGAFVFTKNGNGYYLIDYPNDWAAVHRMIAGMGEMHQGMYWRELYTIMERDHCKDCPAYLMSSASCAQMLEAILKAYRVWED